MKKLAFVFPGQGAQYSGMGQSVSERFPAAAEVFALADRVRPGTSRQCFAGTKEELTDTLNTQPCIYAVENALATALGSKGIVPDMAAGYSLGELAALTCGGVFTLEEGFPLVCHRGELMAKAAAEHPGRMASVKGLTEEETNRVCAQVGDMWIADYNCPNQFVVAGRADKLEAFMAAFGEAGGSARPLAVSGGFHSTYMDGAAAAFEALLRERELMKAPRLPVYSNYTGAPYGGDMPRLLSLQISKPVQWQRSIEAMAAAGADTFVEVGPGKGLSSFIRHTLPDAVILRCDTAELVEEVARALGA